MIQENELITLIFCIVVLFFAIYNYKKLKPLPELKMFLSSFILFTFGWFFTVIEGLIFEEIFKIIEHACYISSALTIVFWAIIYFKKRGET